VVTGGVTVVLLAIGALMLRGAIRSGESKAELSPTLTDDVGEGSNLAGKDA